jgi:single-strand DNA-binding protein
MNYVTVVGNLTRDPELRFTPNGQAVANGSVAVNRRWLNQTTQEWQEEVSFVDFVCWRDLAENVCESLTKGDRVVVSGRLTSHSWEDNDGNKRTKVEISADDLSPSLRFATATVHKTERTRAPRQSSKNDDEEPF